MDANISEGNYPDKLYFELGDYFQIKEVDGDSERTYLVVVTEYDDEAEDLGSGGGNGSGTDNYNDLTDKPSINRVPLVNNKTGEQLGLVDLELFKSAIAQYYTQEQIDSIVSNIFIPTKTSEIENDSEFVNNTTMQTALDTKVDKTNVYTKTETYNRAETYNKNETNTVLTDKVDVEDFNVFSEQTNNEITNINNELANVNTELDNINVELDNIPNNYYNKTQTDTIVGNIFIPTKTSDLQNDSSFVNNATLQSELLKKSDKLNTYTKIEVDNLIAESMSSTFIFVDRVDTLDDLPTNLTEAERGYFYSVGLEGSDTFLLRVWNGFKWISFGNTTIDLSNYYTKSETYNKSEMEALLLNKVDKTDFNTFVSEMNNTIADIDNDIVNLSDNTYKKSETYNQTEIDDVLNTKADSLNVYTKTETDNLVSNSMPTKVSQLENDEKYINTISNSLTYDTNSDKIKSSVNNVESELDLGIVRNPILPQTVETIADLENWSVKADYGAVIFVLETSTYWIYNPIDATSPSSYWKNGGKSTDNKVTEIIDDRVDKQQALSDTLNQMDEKITGNQIVGFDHTTLWSGDVGTTSSTATNYVINLNEDMSNYDIIEIEVNFTQNKATSENIEVFSHPYYLFEDLFNAKVGGARITMDYGNSNYSFAVQINKSDTNNTTLSISTVSAFVTKVVGVKSADKSFKDDYYNKTEINNKLASSSFVFFVNGGQTHWNNNDPNTAYRPTQTGVYENIPAKFGNIVDEYNAEIGSYYATISTEFQGVQLVSDISDKVERIDFEAMLLMQNQVWYNSSIRLIAHAPNVQPSEYNGDVLNFSENTILLMQHDFTAGNVKRNSSVSGVSLRTLLRNTETNELTNHNDWVLQLQMMTDNTQDYISDKSYVIITFNHAN